MSKGRTTVKKSQRAIQREVLFRQQGGLCHDCGCEMTMKRPGGRTSTLPLPKNFATLEHKLARALGGTDHISNLVVSCHGCNNRKSAAEYRQHQVQLGYRI